MEAGVVDRAGRGARDRGSAGTGHGDVTLAAQPIGVDLDLVTEGLADRSRTASVVTGSA
jgi:hypothetical protein